MLPELSSERRSGAHLEWKFSVPAGHPFFGGHFPGHPILPGVVALGWMLAAAERFLDRPLGAIELANLKFQVVIQPNADLELELTAKSGGRLAVVIRSQAGTHASVLLPLPAGGV